MAVAEEAVSRSTPNGAWLVGLEALRIGTQVPGPDRSAFGLKEEPSQSCSGRLTEHLRQKHLLLVLDNCEHLLEESAQIAGHLLRECAGVRILATSREALGITGETAWAVPSLSVPDPAHLPSNRATLQRVLTGYEGIQLFVERAQAVQKTFSLTTGNARLVAQVCFRLEGIPLALELAAARVKAMTVEQIASRLDDHLSLLTGGDRAGQSRQQTLRATLDWSYNLLSEAERLLLMQLSVFAGGWTLEAAEAVCAGPGVASGDSLQMRQVLGLLTSLVEKSLVVFEAGKIGGRYRLLEMVRQYAAQRLANEGNAGAVKARHQAWYVEFAERAEPQLIGPGAGYLAAVAGLGSRQPAGRARRGGMGRAGAAAGLAAGGGSLAVLERAWLLE